MLLKIVYLLVCRILGLAVLTVRRDLATDAELLVVRHENAVLRRDAGRVWYEPADRVWFAALARLLPRRRWTEVFPVTPATLLAWHRKLAASKYDTSNSRKPGRPPTIPGIARLVERSRYHADLARRRYLAVDPANQLVADTLEADWNTALRELADAQDTCDKASSAATELTACQKTRIQQTSQHGIQAIDELLDHHTTAQIAGATPGWVLLCEPQRQVERLCRRRQPNRQRDGPVSAQTSSPRAEIGSAQNRRSRGVGQHGSRVAVPGGARLSGVPGRSCFAAVPVSSSGCRRGAAAVGPRRCRRVCRSR